MLVSFLYTNIAKIIDVKVDKLGFLVFNHIGYNHKLTDHDKVVIEFTHCLYRFSVVDIANFIYSNHIDSSP